MPAWGSPAQVAAAERLIEHNRNNKLMGPAHPNWKGGAWSNEAKAKRKVKWQQQLDRRGAVPKEYPCMLCGVGFTFSQSQRERWYKYGSGVRYSCPHCVNKTAMADIPPYYYAPAECSECSRVFAPQENQRAHRIKHPDTELFCSNKCLTASRTRRLAYYNETNGIMQGPTHPSWKTGWHSKQAQEARRLVYSIKKFINEGESK